MGSFSIGHWLVVLAIVLILFGAGKLPQVMGDVAKGVKNFKAGLNAKDDAADDEVASRRAIGQTTSPASGHVLSKDEAAKG